MYETNTNYRKIILVEYRNEPIIEMGSLMKEKYVKEIIKSLEDKSSYKLIYGKNGYIIKSLLK